MKTKPMTRKSKVAKQCPKCDKPLPVACKSCQCGHQFKKGDNPIPRPVGRPAAGKAPGSSNEPEVVRRRRTERVRRTRPHFYNSLEFVQTSVRRRRNTSASSVCDDVPRKKRGRPRQPKIKEEDPNGDKDKEKEKEDDMYSSVPPENNPDRRQ